MKVALDIERLSDGYRGWLLQKDNEGLMTVLNVTEAGNLDALHDYFHDDYLRALDVRWVVDGRLWRSTGLANPFETAESYITPATWRAESDGEAA